ncbi:MAG: protein phosphatase 2C domain-containing protein [Deltaproteobacteria bacterium]
MIFQTWAKSDLGRQRPVNEDCLYVDLEEQLILVLDGMGGHRAGDVASLLAMETISSFYKAHASKATNNSEIFEDYDESFAYHTNLLRQAVYNANRAVLNQSRVKDEYLGMGSTVAGMAIQEFTVSMVNVGDSRLYLIRDGLLEQISRDHTLAEDQVERGMITPQEARQSQLRHILSSVIGVDVRIRAHMDELAVFPGDIFLLCTDGLTVVMEDSEIRDEILREPPGPETLTRLIDEVNARGGPDNTTLALTVFSEDRTSDTESEASRLVSKTPKGRSR